MLSDDYHRAIYTTLMAGRWEYIDFLSFTVQHQCHWLFNINRKVILTRKKLPSLCFSELSAPKRRNSISHRSSATWMLERKELQKRRLLRKKGSNKWRMREDKESLLSLYLMRISKIAFRIAELLKRPTSRYSEETKSDITLSWLRFIDYHS